MFPQQSSDFHVEYVDVVRHWNPESEPFTGGDALLTALMDGWEMSNTIRKETHWYAGMRFVTVYHFELSCDGEKMVMPVVDNPFVDKLVTQSVVHAEAKLEEVEIRD